MFAHKCIITHTHAHPSPRPFMLVLNQTWGHCCVVSPHNCLPDFTGLTLVPGGPVWASESRFLLHTPNPHKDLQRLKLKKKKKSTLSWEHEPCSGPGKHIQGLLWWWAEREETGRPSKKLSVSLSSNRPPALWIRNCVLTPALPLTPLCDLRQALTLSGPLFPLPYNEILALMFLRPFQHK